MPHPRPSLRSLAGVLPAVTLLTAAALAGCDDSPPPDGVEPLSCDTPTSTRYRVDRVTMPRSGSESEDLAFDLDGDGTLDNMAGNIFSALLQVYPDRQLDAAWQAQLDARLAGPLVWTIEIERCPAGDTRATLVDGAVPLGALADFTGAADDDWHDVSHVELDLDVGVDEVDGRLGVVLTPAYELVLARAFAPFVQSLLDAGETEWGVAVDVDRDGQIEVAELVADTYFRTLTRADVDADADGTNESLSMGLGIHAVQIDP